MTDDINDQSYFIYDKMIRRPSLIASGSTAPGIYCNVKNKVVFIGSADTPQDQAVELIGTVLQYNPGLSAENFYRVANTVYDCIRKARETLLNSVLHSDLAPAIESRRDVINNMGEALDIQLGYGVLDKPNTNDIYNKMSKVKMPTDLQNEYKPLHIYYLATKHGNKSEYRQSLSELTTDKGKIITVRFYEAVRRMLVWYYVSIKHPQLSELNEIDYSQFGLQI